MAINRDLVLVGGVAGGLYLLYRWLAGAGSRAAAAAGQAAEATSSSVADVLEQIFPHANSVLAPKATIVMPDGSEIPASAVKGVGSFTQPDGTAAWQFYYAGKVYRTTTYLPDNTGAYWTVGA